MGPAGGRHTPGRLPSVTLVTLVVTAAALGMALLTSAGQGAAQLAAGMAATVTSLSRQAPDAPPSLRDGRFFTGTPTVGALFFVSGGQLGGHFCTASVVDSPGQDLLITAAHCVTGVSPSRLAFIPGYHDGREPYGMWQVTRVFVDGAWMATGDPDHDVAFLEVHQNGSATPIQALTGGEHLGTGWPTATRVSVVGYPQDRQRPLTCQARTHRFGRHQLEFDCAGYTDGTSGGPFLAHFAGGSGDITVIGVIGGYEAGGDTPAVSYSVRFGQPVRSLYQAAVSDG